MKKSYSLLAGAMSLAFALPAAAQGVTNDSASGVCINESGSQAYRMCIRSQRRQALALWKLTNNKVLNPNSLANVIENRFETYTTTTSNTAMLSKCDEMFSNLTVSNNMVAYSEVQALHRCYTNVHSMNYGRNNIVLPSNSRAGVRASTQSNFRTQRGPVNTEQRVKITSQLSKGTGAPNDSTKTEQASSQVIIEDEHSNGTGVPNES